MQFQLAGIENNDAPILTRWFNNRALCRFMDDSEKDKIYTEEDIFEMIETPSSKSLYFMFRNTHENVGYASIYDIEDSTGSAEFSFLIGNESFQGKGFGKTLLDLLCQKALERGIKKLYCTIYPENQASVKTVLKSGFSQCVSESVKNDELYFEKYL